MAERQATIADNETLEDLTRLRLFNMFDNVSRGELRRVAQETRVLEFDADQVVCAEDSPSDSMYFIYRGEVSVSQKTVTFAYLESGDYFGEMSLITGSNRNATIKTVVPSVLFEITAPVFDALCESSPAVMRNLLLTFDSRLRRHNDVVVGQYLKLMHQYKELEDSHNRLLVSDKMASIGLLTSGIAHEINNPLFVITGYLDVLNEGLQHGEIPIDDLEDIAEKIGTASKSIVKLVSGIKTYARIEKADPVPIDLNSAIQESLDLVSFLYRREDIELVTKLAEGSPVILGNIGKLQQVLMNLFSNAKDAMESSHSKLISVDTREEDGKVIIQVSDTGSGIAQDKIRNIFSRSFTTKPVGKGSGMGLNLVHKIVEEMDGTISVESQESKGTTFCMVFPRHGT